MTLIFSSGRHEHVHHTGNYFRSDELEALQSQIIYKQRFLDYAKEDILHMTPPNFLPKLKNPCWYKQKKDKNGSLTLSCVPYFMLLGQKKCGTTDLFASIVTHPDIISPKGKEPQFWARFRHCYCCGNLTYQFRCKKPNKARNWDDYVNYFDSTAKKIQHLLTGTTLAEKKRSREIITGEASPSNLEDNRWWWNYAVNQYDTEPPALTNANYIHRFMPNLKMIIILRNPVSRLYSDYLFVSEGEVSAKRFHQEVLKEIRSFQSCSSYHDIRYCLDHNSFNEGNVTSSVPLSNGFYVVFIKEYMKFFPRNQFHIIRLDEYSKNKSEVMRNIFRFLDVGDVKQQVRNTSKNSRKKKGSDTRDMLPETRSLLTEFYQPYLVQLADLLGDERYLWKD
ncbi:carbohydrate sulfotransferase 15-like [Mizuhopecten yessoensis]|uniref:carbohydrate sulfotransferase 15-like n=1 Tax=Mizuhopecten yessoensis TaxID=6573 RepID=UPI000B45D781|nr:carbohydrate sulfotransferase 15-like [Mizuhopecten yessoensis]